MTPRPLLLAGGARPGATHAEIRSPEDGQVVALVAQGSAADADEAAEAARKAAEPFARITTDERRRVLEAIARGLLDRLEEFARTICDEAGKPITLARAEVRRAAETFHLAAGDAERLHGEILPIDLSPATAGYRCLVRRVPRGPVLAIGPFNFPLNLLAHKIAPALAVGAPVVVKPPPQAPTVALMLGELAHAVAPPTWPRAFLQVLPCPNDVAERLVTSDAFAVVSFTGSAHVGWHVRQAAGRKHAVLELGGDAGVVVCEDADLDHAAKRIAWGACAYAGQVCISVQRVFVQAGVRAAFEQKLAAAVAAVPVGSARDEKTVSASLIDDRAAERIHGVLQGTKGRLVVGGARRDRRIDPALVLDPDPHESLSREELFGPAVALWSYDRFDEALARVNASEYGLQAGLFTNDLRRMFAAHDALKVGGLIVNEVPTLRVDNYPYGGTKASGIGREGGSAGIAEYTEPRVLVVNAG